ncbi:MAG: alanine/glycine:cation symporter family protein [Bacillota bacterium]|nr:alanine/glycine:cation symporter family protein [Bacillota bacterium]
MLVFLLGTGVYYAFRTNFVQIRKFKKAFKQVFGNAFKKTDTEEGGLSSFQALTTSIAAQIGTGNIAGVATAIAAGGPGAIFWMWLSAFFGMSTIFGEAVLAQKFKTKKDGVTVGGPAYYISEGLGIKWLAVFFAVAIILALGFMGNMVQSNSIAVAMHNAFGIKQIYVGIALAIIAGIIIIGGIKRIGKVTEYLIPIMALFYLLGGLTIIFMNLNEVIPAFRDIFVGAFNPTAVGGGILGAGVKEAFRYGVARGIFSNEAGLGSTPHAHAVAKVKHPAQQGLVAMTAVFIDTMVVCTMTALIILVTRVDYASATGAELVQNAFAAGFGNSFGPGFLAIALFFFAFSTVIGWYYFAEVNVRFLFGKQFIRPFQILVLAFVIFGTYLKVDMVWELADLFNGLMIIPNLIAVVALSGLVIKVLNDYETDFEKSSSDLINKN